MSKYAAIGLVEICGYVKVLNGNITQLAKIGKVSGSMTSPTAEEIVLTRGRSYVNMKKYFSVVVFTTKKSEADKLRDAFGGRIYKHSTGLVWVCSSRRELALLVTRLKDSLPSVHHFEDKLGLIPDSPEP